MDYTREGGYYYARESGMDKDEEEINGLVVHEKGLVNRNTISTRPLSPTKPPKGKTSSLLNGLITNTTGREQGILHIAGHRSRLSREEMNDLERGDSPIGSTHSALLDHVEEARNGYAAAAAAAEAAGGSHRKRSRSWSRTWTGRSRVEGHGKKSSKEKNEVGPTPPTTMTHTKSSSSVSSRPVTPNKNSSRKKFSISGGISGTHAGFAAPKRPEEEVERRRGEDPPRTPTKPAATATAVSDPSLNQRSSTSFDIKSATATAISSSTYSVPKKSIPSPPSLSPAARTGSSTKGASQRSRPPSRPLPPPPPPLEDEDITAAGHAGGEVTMTNTFNSSRPMTSVHDHRSASTNINSSTTSNTTEQQGLKPTPPSGVSVQTGMATTVSTRSQQLAVESNLLVTPPPLPPKLAISTSEGGATKPRVLPPPNHRFSLTLYGSSTGYNPANPNGARLSPSVTRAPPLLPSLTEGVGATSMRRASSMGVYSSASGTGFASGGSGTSRPTSLLPPIPSSSNFMDDMSILNTPNSSTSTRSLTRRLSAMPALPLQGATREAQDDEDDDDEDGDDEDDEDDHDEEETENEHEHRDGNPELSQSRSSFSSGRSYASGVDVDMQGPFSSSSTESSMFIQPRRHLEEGHKNTNVTTEDDSDEVSNSSAYETAPSAASSALPSRQNSLSSKSFSMTAPDHLHDHHLPPIDLGPTPGLGKLDLSFLNQPPAFPHASSSHKGKARMSLTEDAGRTPTAGRAGTKSRRFTQDTHGHAPVHHTEGEAEDYFRMTVVHPHPHPYYRSMSEQTARGGGGSRNNSPARTPRPGDHHISFLSTPVGGAPSFSSRPSSSTGLGLPSFGMTLAGSLPLSRSSSMMSQSSNRTAGGANANANGNMGPNLGLSRASSLSRHSGMYKMASKSLIDVHALEKREVVERIVWEEEEKAERRMIKTRQAKGVYQDKEDGDDKKHIEHVRNTALVPPPMVSVLSDDIPLAVLLDAKGRKEPTNIPIHSAESAFSGKDDHHSASVSLAILGAEEVSPKSGGMPITNTTTTTTSTAPAVDASILSTTTNDVSHINTNRISMAPPYDDHPPPLRRRRSMPTFNASSTLPPPYPAFFSPWIIHPRLFLLFLHPPRHQRGTAPTQSPTARRRRARRAPFIP